MQLSFGKREVRASLFIILFFAWELGLASNTDSKLVPGGLYCTQVLGIKDHEVHFRPKIQLEVGARLQKAILATQQEKLETLAHFVFSKILAETSQDLSRTGHAKKIKLIISDNTQDANKIRDYLQQRDSFNEIALKQHALTMLPSLSVLEDSVFNSQQSSQPMVIIVTLTSLNDWLDEQAKVLKEDRRLIANELLKLTSAVILSEISGSRARDFTPIRTYLAKKVLEFQFVLAELVDTEDQSTKAEELKRAPTRDSQILSDPAVMVATKKQIPTVDTPLRVLNWTLISKPQLMRNIPPPFHMSFDMKMRVLTSIGMANFTKPKSGTAQDVPRGGLKENKPEVVKGEQLPKIHTQQDYQPNEVELIELIKQADTRIPTVYALNIAFPRDSHLTIGKLVGLARYVEGIFSIFKDQTLRNVLNNRADYPFINGTFQMIREIPAKLCKDLRWHHLISRKTALRILLLKPSIIDEEAKAYILGRSPQIQFNQMGNIGEADPTIGIETDYIAIFEAWVLGLKPEELRNRITGKNLEIPGLPKRYFESMREKFPDDWTASLSYECVTKIRETGKIKFSPAVTKLFAGVEREIKTFRTDYNLFLEMMRSKFRTYLSITDTDNAKQTMEVSRSKINQSIRSLSDFADTNSLRGFGNTSENIPKNSQEELNSITSKRIPREAIIRAMGRTSSVKIPKNIDQLIENASLEAPTLVQLELVYPGTSYQHRKMFLEHIIDSAKSQFIATDEEVREATIEAFISIFALTKADLSNIVSVKEQLERSFLVVPKKILLRSLKLVPEIATETLLDYGSGKISIEAAVRRVNATHKTKVGTVMMTPSDQLMNEAIEFQQWYKSMKPDDARAALQDPNFRMPGGLSKEWLDRFISENTRKNGRMPWFTIVDLEVVMSLHHHKIVHFDSDAEMYVSAFYQKNSSNPTSKEKK